MMTPLGSVLLLGNVTMQDLVDFRESVLVPDLVF